MKEIIKVSFLIFYFVTFSFGQNVNFIFKTPNKEFSIKGYERRGLLYGNIHEISDAIGINYYFNSENGKIELKGKEYRLKFTAKNPFVVITPNEGEGEIIQLPVSTIQINGKVYLPLLYTVEMISNKLAVDLIYNSSAKLLTSGIKTEIIVTEKLEEPKEEKPEDKPSAQFNITSINIEEKANGTLVRIKINKKGFQFEHTLRNDILAIKLNSTAADIEKLKQVKGKGLVKEVKVLEDKNNIHIQFPLNKDYTTSEVITNNQNEILITIHNKIFVNKNNDRKKDKWNLDVIVIDAGHGGKDVGAIGVNGSREKDINLSIALKVGKLIEENLKDVKVVYTRKNDTFVELHRRGKIANENGGKLFISIHCNSTPQKPSNANGFEVYLLRPGRTQEAIAIAERENKVIELEENPAMYQKLTDENFILVSMAHSSYMQYSEKFAELLDKEIIAKTKLGTRGVKQAGFYVLVGASMPSVLVEAGFLSNKKDADYLASSKGQTEVAEAILAAVKSYKLYYDLIMDSN